ncbi:pyridoxal-dependent decarboxylase domain-containing protein 1 [Platysternon megacephalum]|uniref:Pyridoxal-dependent decarboxylase domain-containing protein 1 n=1 Tax=Platysternon megacephalum TaxID=55544 RepID=A0A4D9E9I9_9SAUR|nr:pyridoxal-dependent decarboxylase domain-containing protein 1 [Platysternon megacephalum]
MGGVAFLVFASHQSVPLGLSPKGPGQEPSGGPNPGGRWPSSIATRPVSVKGWWWLGVCRQVKRVSMCRELCTGGGMLIANEHPPRIWPPCTRRRRFNAAWIRLPCPEMGLRCRARIQISGKLSCLVHPLTEVELQNWEPNWKFPGLCGLLDLDCLG